MTTRDDADDAEPEVTPPENIEPLKWRKPDIEGLVQFLVHEKSFSEERVRKAADRLLSSKDKANQRMWLHC